MSGPAQVRSTDAIERFGVALARFRQRSLDTLDALEAELRRAVDWLEHDRPAYWRMQIRRAEDGLHQAKMDLQRCLMFPVMDGERPACREEKDALKHARRRLEYCREKVERVRHWKRTMQHELFEYQGRIGALRHLLEVEVPRSEAALKQIVQRLENYTIERAPTAEAPTPLQPNDEADTTAQARTDHAT